MSTEASNVVHAFVCAMNAFINEPILRRLMVAIIGDLCINQVIMETDIYATTSTNDQLVYTPNASIIISLHHITSLFIQLVTHAAHHAPLGTIACPLWIPEMQARELWLRSEEDLSFAELHQHTNVLIHLQNASKDEVVQELREYFEELAIRFVSLEERMEHSASLGFESTMNWGAWFGWTWSQFLVTYYPQVVRNSAKTWDLSIAQLLTHYSSEDSHTLSIFTLIHNKIPPELTDLIIDEVQGDVPTLSSCSLVSRVFHPRARLHSVRKITIGHPSRSNSSQNFLRLLVAAPHIRWLVRTVVIDVEYGFDEDGSWEEMNQRINILLWKTAHGTQWVCRDAALAELLGSLPNLEGFTAGALKWRSSERIPSEVTSFESVLPRRPITTLALNYVHFDSLPSFITILGSFTQLKSLRLGVIIHAPSPADSVVTLSQGPFGLQEVEMNMEGCASVVELFARSASVASGLKRLVLRKCYRGQMEFVRELVSLSKGPLEYLHVDDIERPEDFRK
ncbi:hypothetical protein IW261DRAFT_1574835 [Armillaria novae-zelandiae]|uniref:Uncharacterized protein n=1 Tax=Armillaria novae-zelandiae TaxID=153914 RepID=A0AA39NHJ0_9AGAR|nr:hypothetical protein IW261DRAFT_1574835 [Armillaria novae-zelandiae]